MSEADHKPEFHAQTLPAGSAPADKTFKPNPVDEVPAQGMTESQDDDYDDVPSTSAADTLGGATSADVHTGLGHPGQGMTSKERHHDGSQTRSRQGQGLVGVGASGAPSSMKPINAQDPGMASQRGLNKEVDPENQGRDGTMQANAEEREPENATSVAAEAPSK